MSKRNVTALKRSSLVSLDQQLALAKICSHEGVLAGARAAIVASIVTAIPTMASVRVIPWARANLNHTAQALIISTELGHHLPHHHSLIAVTVASYFVVADKTVLATARRNSFKQPSKSET